jgi:hypothetical protein
MFFNHHLPIFFRIKKPSAKLKISNLIITIFYEFVDGVTLHQHQINISLQTNIYEVQYHIIIYNIATEILLVPSTT